MSVRLNPVGLGLLVVTYAALAAVFAGLAASLPPHIADRKVQLKDDEVVTAKQLAGWFPVAVGGAAAVTLTTGLGFMLLHTAAAGFAQRIDSAEPGSRLAETILRTVTAVRVAAILAGAVLVLLGVGSVWAMIARAGLAADPVLIQLWLALGAGLTSGAAYYRRSY